MLNWKRQCGSIVTAGWLLCAASAMAGTYTVKGGDTLYRIATTHGMTPNELRAANGLSKTAILTVGQKLTVGKQNKRQVESARTTKQKKTAVKETLAAKSGKTISRQESPMTDGRLAKASDAEKYTGGPLRLASSSAMVVDAETGKPLVSKNVGEVKSIASITKLMTAMVALDVHPDMNERLTISEADVDNLKHTSSRLPVGTRLTRYEMLRLALMSSENRASSAIGRHYPGGRPAFIKAMNQKAASLGMSHSRFEDTTGLTPHNVSTAEDLVKMVKAASQYPLIHEFTTTPEREVAVRATGVPLQYRNSNVLVRDTDSHWDIQVSKTGYTQEAGRCLVMMATVAQRSAVLVFLESEGKLSPVGDANRVKGWIESGQGKVALR